MPSPPPHSSWPAEGLIFPRRRVLVCLCYFRSRSRHELAPISFSSILQMMSNLLFRLEHTYFCSSQPKSFLGHNTYGLHMLLEGNAVLNSRNCFRKDLSQITRIHKYRRTLKFLLRNQTYLKPWLFRDLLPNPN